MKDGGGRSRVLFREQFVDAALAPCQDETRGDSHEAGEGVEADVDDLVAAVRDDDLDRLVEEAEQRRDRHGQRRGEQQPLVLAQAFREGVMDKDGNETVLDEVCALVWTNAHSRYRHSEDGGDAEDDPELAVAGASVEHDPDDRRGHDEEAEERGVVQRAAVAQNLGERAGKGEGGVDRDDDGEGP